MKKSLFILLLVVCLLFPSCLDPVPEHFAMISTASFAVPCMFRRDMRGGGYEELEKDEYGRILFSLNEYCVLSNAKETVLVIMQKYDDEAVYFYEDIAYAVEDGKEETRTQLKELNDWNLPIDETKLAKRRVKYTLDNCLIIDSDSDDSRIGKRWETHFKALNATVVDSCISDLDGEQHELYVIVVENESKEREYYFSIVDVVSYEIQYMKIEDVTDFSEDLIAFKKACNWKYGGQ